MLTLHLAERVLATAIRALAVRPGHRGPSAFSLPPHHSTNPLHTLLCVLGPRCHFVDITLTAVTRCWWVDLDYVGGILGDLDLLQLVDRLSNPAEYGALPRRPLQWTNAAVDLASARGRLDVLQWLYQRFGSACWFTEQALIGAAEHGHLEILHWWMDHKQELPFEITPNVLLHATLGGHVKICELWLKVANPLVDKNPTLAMSIVAHALMHATCSNDLSFHMLHWWRSQRLFAGMPSDPAQLPGPLVFKLRDLIWAHRSTSASVIAQLPNVAHQMGLLAPFQVIAGMCAALDPLTDNIAWLTSTLPQIMDDPTPIYLVASSAGNTSGLAWLSKHVSLDHLHPRQVEAIAAHSLMRASGSGHVHVLEWWTRSCAWFAAVQGTMEGSTAVQEASAEGHVHVLEWWSNASFMPFTCTIYTIQAAAKAGHLSVLQWWMRSGKVTPTSWQQDMIRVASEHNQVTVLDWWLEQLDQSALDHESRSMGQGMKGTMAAITAASFTGSVDALTWWSTKSWFTDWHKYAKNMFSLGSPQRQTFDWWIEYLSLDQVKSGNPELQKDFHNYLFLALTQSSFTILLNKYIMRFGFPEYATTATPGKPHLADDVAMRALRSGSVDMFDWWMQSGLPRPDPAIVEVYVPQSGRHFQAWLLQKADAVQK